jgi:ABC-2 type transport system ATP-binding protein
MTDTTASRPDQAADPSEAPATDARRPPATHPSQPPATDPGDVILSMNGVSRAFDRRIVVRDIDLRVRRGTILGVIGPSGSGKTTTIRMLTGALTPSAGEVLVFGERPIRFRRSTREQIGYMPQQFTLYADLTAKENVDFIASLFGLMWRRRRRRTREVLQLLDLWAARDRRAGRLSGGMQRRLELACALVHDPTLLILDEPTAGNDPLLRATVWNELHRLRDEGRTILITTQYVNEAEECDDVALIADGRLVALAPPDELRRAATGGDVIKVTTKESFEGSMIGQVPGVVAVRQVSPTELQVTVDDAATGMPSVVEAIGAAGGTLDAAQEIRLSFDDVFAEAITRSEAARNEAADAERRVEEPAA